MCVCVCACVCVCVCACVCMACVCVCVCVHVCVWRVCVCVVHVCVYVCMWGGGAAVPCGYSISLLIERSHVRCPAAAVVSSSKELYSHCSSPLSCINGDLAIVGPWGSKSS